MNNYISVHEFMVLKRKFTDIYIIIIFLICYTIYIEIFDNIFICVTCYFV